MPLFGRDGAASRTVASSSYPMSGKPCRLWPSKSTVGVKFVVPERPMHCVVNGTAAVLRDFAARQHLLIKP